MQVQFSETLPQMLLLAGCHFLVAKEKDAVLGQGRLQLLDLLLGKGL